MRDAGLISVVVPYWNSEKWLRRCLESLKRQSGDFEFILVDDHSTDAGRMIMDEYAGTDKRFRLITNELTKGVSGARNMGMDCARGEWVTFLDADDEMAENAYAVFAEETKVDANIHQFNHIRQYRYKRLIKFDNNAGWFRINNLPDCWWGVWNKLYRRDFLDGVRYLEGLQYGEDGLFVLTSLAKDKRIHHAEHDAVTVVHHFNNQKSLSHIKQGSDLITQVHAYEDFLLSQNDPEVRRAVCLEISKLWATPRMLELVGG